MKRLVRWIGWSVIALAAGCTNPGDDCPVGEANCGGVCMADSDRNGVGDSCDTILDAGIDDDAATPPTGAERVQCATPVPAATTGICDATAGGAAVLVRGNVLAVGVNYLDGAVLYQGDRIVCVGCDCATTPAAVGATVVSCGGAVISPGLINAHDHLSFNNAAPLASTAAGGTRYRHRHDWRGGVPTPSNSKGTSPTSAGMRWNELRQLLSGTTSMAASSAATGGVRNLDRLEARDAELGFDQIGYQTFPLGDANEIFKPDCTWSYAYGEFELSQLPGAVIHTAEGIDALAHEEFRCQATSFMGGRDYVERNVGLIHGIGLATVDFYDMARDQAKLIWSPRSNISLYGNTAAAPIFARFGGTIALGTDWTYSGSATMNREMACAAQLSATAYAGFFTAEDIWTMATKNGAIATGTQALIGTLAVHKLADLAVYRAAPGQLHQAVIDATTDDVALVVRDGDVLFGEPAVVTALGQTCDPITVCGDERRVCAAREFGGQTWEQIAAVASGAPAAYDAIFCGTPADEPTCIPSRAGDRGYPGPTEADPDGDGIVAGDNCPTMFNPIRPIDSAVQPDDDGDGIGDLCDPTPMRTDLDGDTHDNGMDNCPFDADPTEVDTDGDGKGDACDSCPSVPNPDGVCAPG